MSVQTTLTKVELDIASGNLGEARDRLHGLVSSYPYDLSLRSRLAEVYWRLQYPAMAGRYWYLKEDKSSEMVAACRQFERSCGGDPLIMLQALRFRGDIDPIRETYAGRLLLDLRDRAKRERGVVFRFNKSGRDRYGVVPARTALQVVGGLLVLGTLAALVAIGIFTVFGWIANAIR